MPVTVSTLSLSRPLQRILSWLPGLALALLGACGGSADAPPPTETTPSTPPVEAVAPTIVQPPLSLTVEAGQPAAFSVAATGTDPLHYQWQRDGVDIDGATGTSYTLDSTAAADDGAVFRAVVSNAAGMATSEGATLTVTVPPVDPPPADPPVLTITQQPTSLSVTAGATASFSVAASCSRGTLHIQWQRGSAGSFSDLAGATANGYSLATAAADNGAQFRAGLDCDGQSAATSAVATLTVTTPPPPPATLNLSAYPLTGLRDQAQVGTLSAIDRLPDGSTVFSDRSRVRRLSADLSTISALAGGTSTGSADGVGAAASFNGIQGLTHDSAGNVYVADGGNGTVRRIAPDGTVTTLAGLAGQAGSVDGSGSAARFYSPSGIVLGGDGDLYVADAPAALIRRVSLAGVVSTYAGSGSYGNANGPALAAQFYYPSALVMAANGDLIVADTGNNLLRRVVRSGGGAGAVQTLAGSGSADASAPDGIGTAAGLPSPTGMVLSANTVVLHDGAGLLRRVDLATGAVTTVTGSRSLGEGLADGGPGAARLRGNGRGVTSGPSGGWLLADELALRQVSATGVVSTLTMANVNPSSPAASGVLAQLPFGLASNDDQSVAVDSSGRVVVADQVTQTVRRISTGGAVSLLAGLTGSYGGAVDGQGSAAQFAHIGPGVVADSSGGVWVADDHAIRHITADGTVSLLAGAVGTQGGPTPFGAVDGQGAAARFASPHGLAQGPDGALYVADRDNCAIRRVSSSGQVSTWAGALGACSRVDGPRASARFRRPTALAFGSDGTLWVADNGQLRRLGSDGSVSTPGGLPGGLTAVAVDAAGTVYLGSDSGLYQLAAGGGSATLLIAGGPNDAVVLGASPHLGATYGMAVLANKQLVLLSGSRILLATLP